MAKRLSQAVHIRPSEGKSKTGLNPMRLLLRAILGLLVLMSLLVLSQASTIQDLQSRLETRLEAQNAADTHGGVTRGDAKLSSVFSPEVMYWQADLLRWGKERSVNPNLLATIMQIESCGHPNVSSSAGAQGLFQVMPFHFEDGQNQINPEQNAQSGIDHLKDCLVWTDYDVTLTLACYNGGPSIIGRSPDQWFTETQNYARWGVGLYNEATQNADHSRTLDQWLTAGGSVLCQEARFTQDFILPAIVSKP